MTHPIHLIGTIRDEFEVFPIQSVLESLAQAIKEADDTYHGHFDASGDLRRTVAQENEIEVMSILIGAAFVAAQAMVTRVVSLVDQIAVETGARSDVPRSKVDVMKLGARVHAESGHSEIVLINAVANCFKHSDEWPDDWETATGNARTTIGLVQALGLRERNADNMRIAVDALGLRGGVLDLTALLRDWRLNLADQLENALDPPR